MNEQERFGQLSALFDGELPADQATLAIRRAVKDPSLRAHWERYALIGACLRNEPLPLPGRASVADRVAARLAAEPELLAPVRMGKSAGSMPAPARSLLSGRGMLGGAIAAGVALVSIFLVREMAPVAGGTGGLVADAAAPAAAVQTVAQDIEPGYTTPLDTTPASQHLDRSLVSYVLAHGEVSSSAYRMGPLSSSMYGGYDPTIGTVEMADAQGAAR